MVLRRLLLGAFLCGLSINLCASQPVKTEDGAQWNLNGSKVTLIVNGSHLKFIYTDPRAGLREEGVLPGTKAFDGTVSNGMYQGTEYVFSKICGTFGYHVSGYLSSDRRQITMSGQAPHINSQCQIVSYKNVEYDFILDEVPVSAQEQEGHGQNEYFGDDGKLYSVENSETEVTDVIKYYLLYRRPINGEEGLYYDGKIRIVTEILGGGFTNEEVEFLSICSIDGDLSVSIGQHDNQKEVTINLKLTSPAQSEHSAYNLWWATCKNQFQKFK
jgi:hypothetical protein